MSEIRWDQAAVERFKREALRTLQSRLDAVRCPVHGTRVSIAGLDAGGGPVLEEVCCDELQAEIARALR